MCSIHRMEYSSEIKKKIKNKLLTHEITSHLRSIMPSERSRAQKYTYHIIPFIGNFWKGKILVIKSNLWLSGARNHRKNLTARGYEGTFQMVEMFYIIIVLVLIWPYTSVKIFWILYIKFVDFSVCDTSTKRIQRKVNCKFCLGWDCCLGVFGLSLPCEKPCISLEIPYKW